MEGQKKGGGALKGRKEGISVMKNVPRNFSKNAEKSWQEKHKKLRLETCG